MKKVFLVTLMLTVLLCGCQADREADTSDYKGDISKAQEIAVISADTSEVLERITEQEDIENFVTELDVDTWTLEKVPEDAKEVGSFGLSQEKTIELGETETDGTLYDVCKITLYDSSYINFEMAGLNMTFKVSGETEAYLREYFN